MLANSRRSRWGLRGFVLGYLALLLPGLLYLVAGWRSRDGVPGWKPLDSVSEYYYSGAVAILTGVLWAVGLFGNPDFGGTVEQPLDPDPALGARQRSSRAGVDPPAEGEVA